MDKKQTESKISQFSYFKRFTLWFIVGIAFSFFCIGLVTYIEDPMHFYRYDSKKGIYHDARIDLDLEKCLEFGRKIGWGHMWQSYGLVHSFPHNFLIVGASNAGYPLKETNQCFDVQSIRANIGKCNFFMASAIIRETKSSHILFVCDQDFGIEKTPDSFPVSWYEKRWYRHFLYCLKPEMFLISLENIFYRITHQKNLVSPDNFFKKNYGKCGKREFLSYLKKRLSQASQDRKDDFCNSQKHYQERIDKFNTHILKTIQALPHKNFYVVLPANVIFLQRLNYKKKIFDLHMKVRRHLVRSLLSLKNVKIFDMESDTRLTADLNAYPDFRHHNKSHYVKILNFMRKGENLITPQNVENFHQRFEKSVKSNKLYGE